MILFGWYKKFIDGDSFYHWDKGMRYFKDTDLEACINQIVRLSNRIVNKILDFRKKHNKFIFHEILFASLRKINNFTKMQYKNKLVISYSLQKSIDMKLKPNPELKDKLIILHPYKKWYDTIK